MNSLRQGRNTDDDDCPPAHESTRDAGPTAAIVVEVLDHVQGQHRVTNRCVVAQRTGQVGLDQPSARAVEQFERPPRDVQADRLVAALSPGPPASPPSRSRHREPGPGDADPGSPAGSSVSAVRARHQG